MKHKISSIVRTKGMLPLLLIQIFYSFGFFILFTNLTLYCANALHVSDHTAYHISSTFLALVYALAVFGGYLSNRFLGYTYAFPFAATLCTIGFALLLIKNFGCFYYGLATIAIADGIAIPTIYVLLGSLFGKNTPNRTHSFILAYVGMNIGSILGATLSGPIAEHLGYHFIFLISLCFTIFTLFIFCLNQPTLKTPEQNLNQTNTDHKSFVSKIFGTLITLLFIPFIALIIAYPNWSSTILISIGLFAFLIIFYIGRKNPKAKNSMRLFSFLCLLYIIFWTVYFIIPTVLPLFIHRNVDRVILGMNIPAASFYAVNPITIILLGPFTGFFWIYLANKNILSSIPGKFALGLSIIGIGYLVLSLGILNHNDLGMVSWIWAALAYFVLTLGELCIGPIGYAMVGDIVPHEYEGLMMGIWQLMAGFASVLTGALSQFIDHTDDKIINPLLTAPNYLKLFLSCGIAVTLIAASVGIVLKFKQGYQVHD